MEEATGVVERPKKRKRRTSGRQKKLRKKAALQLSNEDGDVESLCGSDTESDSKSESDQDEGMTLQELEIQLEKNAAMKKLTVTNVKSILHHVLSDKRLIALAKTSAGEEDKKIKDQTATKSIELTMTRAMRKQNKEDIEEQAQEKFFVEMELSEDSEDDQEYKPDLDLDVVEEDGSPHISDLPSPLKLPQEESSQSIECGMPGEEDDEEETHTQREESEEFKMPEAPGNEKVEPEPELISRRTRSKCPMKDLSLEAIEAGFCDPDFDPEMYGSESVVMDEEDIDWQLFLGSLMSGDSALNDSIDDVDEDFNYMEDEEEEIIDQEEYRDDRAVRVSQRELQDMFDELLEGFEPLTLEAEDFPSPRPRAARGVVFHPLQRSQLAAQFEQHLQLLVQLSLLCYYETSLSDEAKICKDLVKELKVFNDRAKELTKDNQPESLPSAFCISGIDEAASIIEAHSDPPLPEHCHFFTPVPPGETEALLKKKSSNLPTPIPCMAANKFAKCSFFSRYPELIPVQGMTSRSAKGSHGTPDLFRVRFTAAEDNLLALGIMQFNKNYKLISEQLLPTKTQKQLKNRCKNLRSKREPLNAVKVFYKTGILPPLMADFVELEPRGMQEEPLCKRYADIASSMLSPEWLVRVAEKYHFLPKALVHQDYDEKTKAYMRRNQLRFLAVKTEHQVVDVDDCSDFHLLQPTAVLQMCPDPSKPLPEINFGQVVIADKREDNPASTVSSTVSSSRAASGSPRANTTLKGSGSPSMATEDNPFSSVSSQIPARTVIQLLPADSSTLRQARNVSSPKQLIPLQPVHIAPTASSPSSPKPLPKLKAASPFNTIRPTRCSPGRRIFKSSASTGSLPYGHAASLCNTIVGSTHLITSSTPNTSAAPSPQATRSEMSTIMSDSHGNSLAGFPQPLIATTFPSLEPAKPKEKARVQKKGKASSNTSRLKFNWAEKHEEKGSRYADYYFQKAKDTISSKQPELWMEFLFVMDTCNRKGLSALEIYKKLTSILKDFPTLLDDFVAFLTEIEAHQVGKFMVWLDFSRARTFLLKCESLLVKHASCYQDMLKTLMQCYENRKTSAEFVEAVLPFFQGNQALLDEFTRFFPDLPPPPCKSEDFEVIYYSEEHGFGNLDEFEDVPLLPDSETEAQCNKKNRLMDKVGRGPKLNKNIRLPKSPGQNSTRRTAWNAKRAAVRTLTTSANSRKPRHRRVLIKDGDATEMSDLGVSSIDTSDSEGVGILSPCDSQTCFASSQEECTASEDSSQTECNTLVQGYEREESLSYENASPQTQSYGPHGDFDHGNVVDNNSPGPSKRCWEGALVNDKTTRDNAMKTAVKVTQREEMDIRDQPKPPWTSEEDGVILAAFQELDNCDSVFTEISKRVQGRSSLDIMNRFKELIRRCTFNAIASAVNQTSENQGTGQGQGTRFTYS